MATENGQEALPSVIRPMLAEAAAPFDSPDYVFEVKWDGYRSIVFVDNHLGTTRLQSRNLKDITQAFPELAILNRLIPADQAIVDGEIVLFHEEKPDFHLLQKRGRLKDRRSILRASAEHPVTFVAFDLLYWNRVDIRNEPLLVRKSVLQEAIGGSTALAVYSRHVPSMGKSLFRACVRSGLEGVVGKRAGSPYLEGRRSRHWLKVPSTKEQDCVVGGFVAAGPKRFKSLAVGVQSAGARDLRYLGNVGTGFGEEEARHLSEFLYTHTSSSCPFENPPKELSRRCTWVKPLLVGTVGFLDYTPDGHLRHPVWKGERTDKHPSECLVLTEPASKSPATSY